MHPVLYQSAAHQCSTGCFQAPAEAEAELACLNEANVIDAITAMLSDDVDTLLFGGTHIICKCAPSQLLVYMVII